MEDDIKVTKSKLYRVYINNDDTINVKLAKTSSNPKRLAQRILSSKVEELLSSNKLNEVMTITRYNIDIAIQNSSSRSTHYYKKLEDK